MTSSTTFEGKVALVTGAAAGIGKATALAFAEAGAAVIVADVQSDKGLAVVECIKSEGGSAAFVKCDVRSEEDIRNMVSETVRRFGRLDCAFNNAGVPGGAFVPLAEQTNETWDQVINTDLRGVWLCMKHEIRQMLEQGGRCNRQLRLHLWPRRAARSGELCCGQTRCGWPNQGGGARLCNSEHAHQCINAVCPSAIFTDGAASARETMHHGVWEQMDAAVVASQPNGRWGTSQEVADAVLWLCSPGASLMLGHALAVDGGLTSR